MRCYRRKIIYMIYKLVQVLLTTGWGYKNFIVELLTLLLILCIIAKNLYQSIKDWVKVWISAFII